MNEAKILEGGMKMRLKVLGFALVCLPLLLTGASKFNHAGAGTVQEDSQMAKQREIQIISMKEITVVSTALADYITDFGIAPKQDGTYDENIQFYKALAPFYVRNVPVYDGWGNAYRVYCGEACNGKYGIFGCGSDDFLVISYGRDGMKEDWVFDSGNPAAGLYESNNLDDFDKDLIIWNGSWIRAPKLKR
jgi:hypothetical protein